jgi:hypothetical protein
METLLDDIQDIARRMGDGSPPASLRREIAELIDRALVAMSDSPSYWTKLHIASACSSLLQGAVRRSDYGLRLALHDLWDAFLPEGTYNEDYCERNTAIDELTSERFSAAARAVLVEAVCA